MATIEQDARFTLKDEDILVHKHFAAYDDIPYGWHVLVVQAGEPWEKLMTQINNDSPTFYARPDVQARTTMDHFPNPDGSIGTMYFRSDGVWLELITHEALHMASWMCRSVPGISRRMTFGVEPEAFANIIGRMVAVTWENLEDYWTK